MFFLPMSDKFTKFQEALPPDSLAANNIARMWGPIMDLLHILGILRLSYEWSSLLLSIVW